MDGKKTKRSYSKKKPVSKAIKAYVDKKVKSDGELYMGLPSTYASQLMTFNPTGSVAPTVLNLTSALASISQGVGQGNRRGNSISLKKLMFRGLLNNDQGTAATGVISVYRVIIAKIRSQLTAPVAADFGSLLQFGNTTTPLSNQMIQIYNPLNRDYWDIKKTFITKLNGIPVGATNPGDYNSMDPSNGGGLYKQFSIDLAKYLPKDILYSEASATPTNAALYMFIMAGNAVNPGASAVLSAQISATVTPYYHDK